jgi:hypothetical protein
LNKKPGGEAIVAEFIIESRGKGPFLSVEDYAIVSGWFRIFNNCDQILLILSDIFDQEKEKGHTPASRSLSYYNKSVSKRLQEQAISRA